jgi:uncharacterized protein (DUF433 family)
MQVAVAYPHIVYDLDIRSGRPIIEGTRIAVQDIVEYFTHYKDIDRVLLALPGLSPAQVHSALTFYYDHKLEMDEDIAESKNIDRLKSHGVKIFEEEFGAS